METKRSKDLARIGKVQVRFWDDSDHYKQFKDECEKHGVSFQEAFLSLMDNFIQASKQGQVQVE